MTVYNYCNLPNCKTFCLVLSRVAAFLPKLRESNALLSESDNIENVDMSQPHIQMVPILIILKIKLKY